MTSQNKSQFNNNATFRGKCQRVEDSPSNIFDSSLVNIDSLKITLTLSIADRPKKSSSIFHLNLRYFFQKFGKIYFFTRVAIL